MSKGAMTPRTEQGGELQAIQPGKCITTDPVTVTAAAQVTSEIVGNEGFYIYCDSVVHVRVSQRGELVDNTYPPIDARGGTVLAANSRDRVSFMLKAGEPEALIWICPLVS